MLRTGCDVGPRTGVAAAARADPHRGYHCCALRDDHAQAQRTFTALGELHRDGLMRLEAAGTSCCRWVTFCTTPLRSSNSTQYSPCHGNAVRPCSFRSCAICPTPVLTPQHEAHTAEPLAFETRLWQYSHSRLLWDHSLPAKEAGLRFRIRRTSIRAVLMAVVLPALLLLPAGAVSADDQLFEYFSDNIEGNTNIGGGQRVVQTFTAMADHGVSAVELYLNNPYGTQSATISILECGSGDPGTWTVLDSTVVDIGVTLDLQWVAAPGFSCDLEGGQQYGIFATTSDTGIYWGCAYSGGTWSSPGSPGESWRYYGDWEHNPDRTFGFKVHGPALPPAADFSAQPRSGSAPLQVTFADESTGSVTSWLWSFGDGATSTKQNPTHTYRSGGRYDVSLKVSGPAGSDTLTRAGYIYVRGGSDDRPPEPARLGVSYLNIDPAQVLPNQEVVISANICNSGEERGSKTVSLMLNGQAIDSQSVSVSGGACQQVVFKTSRAVPGAYQVAVDGMVGQFSVLAPRTVTNNVPSQQSTGLGTAGIVAIIAVLIVLILALIMVFKRD